MFCLSAKCGKALLCASRYRLHLSSLLRALSILRFLTAPLSTFTSFTSEYFLFLFIISFIFTLFISLFFFRLCRKLFVVNDRRLPPFVLLYRYVFVCFRIRGPNILIHSFFQENVVELFSPPSLSLLDTVNVIIKNFFFFLSL